MAAFRAPVCFISSGLIFYRQRNCTLQYYLRRGGEPNTHEKTFFSILEREDVFSSGDSIFQFWYNESTPHGVARCSLIEPLLERFPFPPPLFAYLYCIASCAMFFSSLYPVSNATDESQAHVTRKKTQVQYGKVFIPGTIGQWLQGGQLWSSVEKGPCDDDVLFIGT